MTQGKQRILRRAYELAIKQLELQWEELGRPETKDFKINFEVRLDNDVVMTCCPRGTLTAREEPTVEGAPRYERPEVL